MKNVFFKAGTTLMIIFLFACTGNTPERVAKNYLKAFNNHEFEEAKKYGTEVTAKLLDMQIAFLKMGTMPEPVVKDRKIKMLDEKIINDTTAVVTYQMEGSKGDQTLNLVKLNGQWKVEMSKDNLNGNAIMDTGATNTDTDVTIGTAPLDSTVK